ncbi:unnamed protein product [Clonostachys byssicola]|uniref:Uncharacterized protein n=1 Tax=Clonostachys byssicola TaxID=160290 RepID=A0A9N9UQQ8_9HYPO|nr:unnamed protein product [Clonostachys byssicola]
MCYQVVELYSACKCLYYKHAVDRCVSYGRKGHYTEQRTIYVGYACAVHTSSYSQPSGNYSYSDSGYYSGRSHTSYRVSELAQPIAAFAVVCEVVIATTPSSPPFGPMLRWAGGEGIDEIVGPHAHIGPHE